MPVNDELIGWFSPDPRGVLRPADLRMSRSLRRSCRRYEIRVDTAFGEVVEACADPRRPHGWISRPIAEAYTALHEMGWAHSIEAWSPEGQLLGGLYGVSIGSLFAGESMFHREADASKVALVGLVEIMSQRVNSLIDVQWRTEHLETLGAIEVDRDVYIGALSQITTTEPMIFAAPAATD